MADPDLAGLAPLLGTWTGHGHGGYPTIQPFDYVEHVEFAVSGKPFIVYRQRTVHAGDGRPLHMESGYLRPVGEATIELVVVQPTGITEVDEGSAVTAGTTLELDLQSRHVGLTSTATPVTGVRRRLRVDGPTLRTELWMAAVGQPMTHHLSAELTRVDDGV